MVSQAHGGRRGEGGEWERDLVSRRPESVSAGPESMVGARARASCLYVTGNTVFPLWLASLFA